MNISSIGKRNLVIVVVLLALILFGVGAWALSSKQAPAKVSSNVAQKPTAKSRYNNATLYKKGETVEFASEEAVLNSATVSQSISSAYSSPIFAANGTKFLILNMTVTNTTSSPFTYNPFILIDQKDRLFNAYTNTIGNIDNYLEAKQLSPSVPLTGNEVYQVPSDSTTFRVGGYVGSSDKLKLIEFTL